MFLIQLFTSTIFSCLFSKRSTFNGTTFFSSSSLPNFFCTISYSLNLKVDWDHLVPIHLHHVFFFLSLSIYFSLSLSQYLFLSLIFSSLPFWWKKIQKKTRMRIKGRMRMMFPGRTWVRKPSIWMWVNEWRISLFPHSLPLLLFLFFPLHFLLFSSSFSFYETQVSSNSRCLQRWKQNKDSPQLYGVYFSLFHLSRSLTSLYLSCIQSLKKCTIATIQTRSLTNR